MKTRHLKMFKFSSSSLKIIWIANGKQYNEGNFPRPGDMWRVKGGIGDRRKWIIHKTLLHGSKREEGKWWKTGRTVSPFASFLCAGVQGFHRNLNIVWIWGKITFLPSLFNCHKSYPKIDVWFQFFITRTATYTKNIH